MQHTRPQGRRSIERHATQLLTHLNKKNSENGSLRIQEDLVTNPNIKIQKCNLEGTIFGFANYVYETEDRRRKYWNGIDVRNTASTTRQKTAPNGMNSKNLEPKSYQEGH